MLVQQKMTKKPLTVGPQHTLAAVRKKMDAGRFRRLPVLEGDKLVGIISDRDLRQHTGMLDKTRVNAVMTQNVVTVSSSTMIERAARLLLRHKIGGLPVVDDGKLVGMITTTDMLKALVGLVGAEEQHLARIDLVRDPETDRPLTIGQILAAEVGEVLGFGSYRVAPTDTPVFYVRVPAHDAEKVAEAMRQNGLDVLAIHE
jgi:acetoin utilization protein AcuB